MRRDGRSRHRSVFVQRPRPWGLCGVFLAFSAFADASGPPKLAGIAGSTGEAAGSELPAGEVDAGALARSPRAWRDLSVRLPAIALTAIAIDPGDPETWFVGGDGIVLKTDDAGESWRMVLAFPRGTALWEQSIGRDLDPFDDPGTADDARARTLLDDAALLQDQADELDEDGVGDEATSEVESADESRERLQEMAEDLLADAQALQMPQGDADLAVTVSPRQASGVRAIAFEAAGAAQVWIATPRGLFRSRDRGESFVLCDLPGGEMSQDVRAIAVVEAGQSRKLLAGTAQGLWWSQNGGEAWQRAPDLAATLPVLEIAAGPGDQAYLATEQGLFAADLADAHFARVPLRGVPPLSAVLSVAVDPLSGTLYAGTSQGLYAGAAGARLLEQRGAAGFGRPVVALSTDPRRPHGLAVGEQGGGLWLSADGGREALSGADALPALEVGGIARRPDDPDALLVATERGLFGYLPGALFAVAGDRLQPLERDWAREPTWAETARAALRYAGMEAGARDGEQRRIQASGFAPRLRAEYRVLSGRPNRIEYVVVTADLDELDAVELQDFARDNGLELNPRTGVRHEFFVWLSWNLDRAWLSPWELMRSRLEPARLAAEQRILRRVRTAYTARRRLAAERQLSPDAEGPRGQALQQLRLEELTALLDAQTGGYFSAESRARGAAASSSPMVTAP